MYINFWYPIAKSEDIKDDEPIQTQVLGLRFVAFRDKEGAAHVLSDTCVHRGGSLGKGWVKDGCVVCPYHGWRYDGDGVCTTVPSLVYDSKPPARAKVDSYPVEERYGILFAFLGDLPEEERPPIWDIKEFGQDGWRESKIHILDVDFYFERSVENGLDPAHNEFVHPLQGAPGMVPDYLNKPLNMSEYPWGSKFKAVFGQETTDTEFGELRTDAPTMTAGSGHLGPNQLVTWIEFAKDTQFHQYFFEAPVDECHTRIFFLNLRNCMLEENPDKSVDSINLRVADEDIAVISELNPIRTPESNIKEVLTPSDQAVVRYREQLKEWERNGWRIDLRTLREKRGDVAFAIPSPARRTTGNWVLDPIPLFTAADAVKAAAE